MTIQAANRPQTTTVSSTTMAKPCLQILPKGQQGHGQFNLGAMMFQRADAVARKPFLLGAVR